MTDRVDPDDNRTDDDDTPMFADDTWPLTSPRPPATTQGSPVVWLVVALVVVAAAAVSWIVPTTRATAVDRAYTVKYTFDYGLADGTRNTSAITQVYGPEGVRFGAPLFAAVVDEIEVDVDFTVTSPNVLVEKGEMELMAMLKSTAGWVRPLGQEVVQFVSPDCKASLVVNFGAAREQAAQMDALTGVSGTNTVVIVAATDFRGFVENGPTDGRPMEHTSNGLLSFELTPNTASLEGAQQPAGPSSLDGLGFGVAETRSDPSGGESTAPTADSLREQMVPTMMNFEITGPNRLSALWMSVDVEVLRNVLAVLALLLVLGALRSLVIGIRARRLGDRSWLLARHGGSLVPASPDFTIPPSTLDVGSFRALQIMGAAAAQPIIYKDVLATQSADFYVIDGANSFRYHAEDKPLWTSADDDPDASWREAN